MDDEQIMQLEHLDDMEKQTETLMVMHKQQFDFHDEKIRELVTMQHQIIDRKREILGMENDREV